MCNLSFGKNINPGCGELCFPKINDCWFMIRETHCVWTFLLQQICALHLWTYWGNSSSLVKSLSRGKYAAQVKTGRVTWLVLEGCCRCHHCRRTQSYWEWRKGTPPGLYPSLRSFSPHMHSASKQSHFSIYHSLLFSAGYLRGSMRKGPSLWQPLQLLDGAQGCKSKEKKAAMNRVRSLPSPRFNGGVTGGRQLSKPTFEHSYVKIMSMGWNHQFTPLQFSPA